MSLLFRNPSSAGVGMLCLAVALAVAAPAAGQGSSEFLGRLDANGNGMIDPQELEGRFGGFIRRMAENNPRLDLSRPIPIDRLGEEFSRMREERMRGGGGPPFSSGGGPPFSPGGGMPFSPGGGTPFFPGGGMPFSPWGGPPGGDGGRGPFGHGSWGGGPPGGPPGSSSSSPYAPRATKVEPLVPGFGVQTSVTPPALFGAEADLFRVQVTDDDRREAERSFRRYDRNQDGKVDRAEMAESRYASELPMYDQNHDGVLTLNEMEYRYARRRVENERDARSGDSPGSWGGSRGDRRDGDRRDGRSWGDGSRGEHAPAASAEQAGDTTDRPKSYRRKSPLERLPAGLPEWFARDDGDQDGQIAFREFATSWSETVAGEFNQFDLNRDGFITPPECLRAKDKGAVRSSGGPAPAAGAAPVGSAPSGSAPSGIAEFGNSAPAASEGASPPAAAAPAPAAAPVAIAARQLDYAKKVIEKYDKSGDGELTADEWGQMAKNPEAADADRNGRITREEYARWLTVN